MTVTPLRQSNAWSSSLRRATVTRLVTETLVEVRFKDDTAMICEAMRPLAESAPNLAPGDSVMVAPPEAVGEHGCILGILGRPTATQSVPDVLRIEAGQELHLVCGQGSIAIRADGKVVVRGLDIVSVSEGRNRIKGAAVEIN